MGFLESLRRLFGWRPVGEEAAEQEEYGLADVGEARLERQRLGSRFGAAEGAETAEEDLDSFERPDDPAP